MHTCLPEKDGVVGIRARLWYVAAFHVVSKSFAVHVLKARRSLPVLEHINCFDLREWERCIPVELTQAFDLKLAVFATGITNSLMARTPSLPICVPSP